MSISVRLDSRRLTRVRRAVLGWFDANGRDLPWRRTRDPYAVLVAEVMLQQTQVSRVLPRYERFLRRFPDVFALADAPPGEVIREWSGLGYNSRAVRLQAAARAVVVRHDGVFPSDEKALRELPGIGPYTAAAVLCFAFEQDVPLVDTNHRRVLGRLFLDPHAGMLAASAFPELAAAALPAGRGWAWNQALMDLGALVCTARAPRCGECPAAKWCLSAPRPGLREAPASYVTGRQPRFAGSRRWLRGRVVRLLAESGRPRPLAEVAAALESPEQDLRPVLAALECDGLIVERDGWLALP